MGERLVWREDVSMGSFSLPCLVERMRCWEHTFIPWTLRNLWCRRCQRPSVWKVPYLEVVSIFKCSKLHMVSLCFAAFVVMILDDLQIAPLMLKPPTRPSMTEWLQIVSFWSSSFMRDIPGTSWQPLTNTGAVSGCPDCHCNSAVLDPSPWGFGEGVKGGAEGSWLPV